MNGKAQHNNLTKLIDLALETTLGYSPKYKNEYDLGKKSVGMTCPTCSKSIKEYEDAQFVEEYNMCLGCDDIKGEVDGMMQLEAMDVLSSMAEEHGMDVDEYLDMI